MMRRPLSRLGASVLALVGLFLLAVVLTAVNLIWSARQSALADSDAQATHFVSGAESALNRSLLRLDVLLASMDNLLGLSGLVPEWIDVPTANRLMQGVAQQELSVRFVALVNPQGRVVASSDPSGSALALTLPAGFVDAVLAQPISTLLISAPVVSFASSERVLYLARHLKLADSSKLLAVAEVPVQVLASILIQGGDIHGLEVTLERGNGELLASAPPQEQLLGTRLTPALGPQANIGTAMALPARLGGAPAYVLTRPTLYQDVLITASIPTEAALQNWRKQRNAIAAVALAFTMMVAAAGAFAFWYMNRLAQARAAIAQSKIVLDQALESMVSGFVLLDAEQRVLRWNRRFTTLYPWSSTLMAPMLPFAQLVAAGSHHLTCGSREEERQVWVTQRLALLERAQSTHEQHLTGGQVVEVTERRIPEGGTVITYQDITALRQATDEIQHLAFYDALTLLPNRRLLMNRIEHAMVSNARSGRYGALLFLDLDHFKNLNDTLGHDVGDLLLQQVAQRLKACVREEDTVARLGGDEFVVMLDDLCSASTEAANMAQLVGTKILECLNQPYQLAQHAYHSTPSIGATLFGAQQIAAADLLKQADIAMYQAKSNGRNALCFFDPQMQAAISLRAQLENDLHTALRDGQFHLHYQPQFHLDGAVVGAEALIRWQHPQRGLVPPGDFIAVAEDCALIVPIGLWVLRTACLQLVAWQDEPRLAGLQLSVNVSARQFRHPAFVEQVAAVVRETGVQPQQLALELTESLVLINVNDTVSKMDQLRALGLRFSVDDFGTGHSSLAYLTRLPLDQLKIDQSFVRNIGLQHTDDVIVQTIIGMARNLGLEVIAEGVETTAQHAFLAAHGCTLFQGYLLGKPMSVAQLQSSLA